MSTELADVVVEEFEQRSRSAPAAIREGSVRTYPHLDREEEGAFCSLCGYWGVVPARSDILDAIAPGTDRSLVCATCADEVDLEEGDR